MIDNTSNIFTIVNENARLFLTNHGYCQFRIKDTQYMELISNNFLYYSKYYSLKNTKTAFNNSNGVPRHIQDIFRDPNSFALDLYRCSLMQNIYGLLFNDSCKLVSTHSKLSLKTPGEQSSWYPHQDNGYKKKSLKGFSVFIPLEDMNHTNGCLEIFPNSHSFGTLPHSFVNMDPESQNGDIQLIVDQVPSELASKPLEALAGDIIIFSLDMLHQSGISSSNSFRLALITEIEEYGEYFVDDYSMRPIFLRGQESIYDFLRFSFYKMNLTLKNKLVKS